MKKILPICVVLAVAIAVLIWYYLPIKRTATIELYCDDPTAGTLYAEFDLKISRSVFSPPVINGTIRIGEKEYVAWAGQKYGFIRNIQRKVNGEMNIPAFVNAENFGQGTDSIASDLIYIHSIQFGDHEKIENVRLSLTSDDYGMWSSCTETS